MDLRMKCQTEMSRGPLAEEDHGRKEIVGGGQPSAGRPPTISLLPWSSSAFPLAFLFAIHTETQVGAHGISACIGAWFFGTKMDKKRKTSNHLRLSQRQVEDVF